MVMCDTKRIQPKSQLVQNLTVKLSSWQTKRKTRKKIVKNNIELSVQIMNAFIKINCSLK